MPRSFEIRGRDVETGRGTVIKVLGGQVVSIDPGEAENDCWVCPGLVDLQVNGYRGFDLNGDEMNGATVSALVRKLLAAGVTTFAPTLITASQEQLLARLEAIAEARRRDLVARACIPYIHVEGPHISPQDGYRGAHPAQHVRPPSMDEFSAWQNACGGLVGMVTISPHFPGSEDYIRALCRRRVRVSLGHTHASAEQIDAAVRAGARLSTHLGNGIPSQIERHNNPLWSQLAEPRLTAMLIADGNHLPAPVLRAILQAKTVGRCILVSDVVALAGSPPGRYKAPIGGEVELSADGRLSMVGASGLAGAARSLLDCVGTAVALTGLPLHRVLRMATLHPGRIARQGGSLAPGMRADVLQFRWDGEQFRMHVQAIWLAGEIVRIS